MDVPITELLPTIANGLKDPNPKVRGKASGILAEYESLPGEALPLLTEALNNTNPTVRRNAVFAIEKMGLTADRAVPALIQALQDVDRDVQGGAVNALEAIGPGAKEAIGPLGELYNKDTRFRRGIVRTLTRIDVNSPAALPIFLQSLEDDDPDVCREAIEALQLLGSIPPAAIPSLKDLAANHHVEFIRFKAQSLLKDSENRSLAPALQTTLRPQIEPVLLQLDKSLNSDRTPIKTREAASKYLHERNIRFETGRFWSSLQEGYPEEIEAFLQMGISPNIVRDGGVPYTPLLFSTSQCDELGQAQITLILLMYGADLNCTDTVNRTPLFSAIEHCPTEIVETFLKAGARMDIATKGGATILSEAVSQNRADVVRLLLKSGYKIKNEPSYLLNSAKRNPEITQMLLKAGVKK